MIHLSISPTAPEAGFLERAAAAIRAGGMVACPTDTLYGLAVDPFNPAAVERVFLAKARPAARALPLIAADERQIASQLGPLSLLALRLAARFWPGPLTLLMPAPSTLAAAVTGGTGQVGVRVPAHEVARSLCRAVESVLTATSANASGEAGSCDPAVVAATLGPHLDVLLDAGCTSGGPPSTIVDTTGAEPQLVRAGAVPWEVIQACRTP